MRQKLSGLKYCAEALDSRVKSRVVGERSLGRRRYTVRSAGGKGSENAGISNEERGKNPLRRKSKVSRAMLVNPGLVGP